MNTAPLQTENLELLLQTPAQTLGAIEALSPADRAEVSPVWLAMMKASLTADPWIHGFTMLQRSSGSVVGSCGYKGPPDADAVVEIAYAVRPDYQGRGYATEAAAALTAFAFGSGKVRTVRAHTLPRESASTHVLTKCGFARLGEVIDPEDGLVWRWEVRIAAA